MKHVLASVLLFGSLLSATPVSADIIDDLRMTQDDTGVSLDLSTPDTLAPPRVRTSAGMVRVWFANVENDPRIERRGDGGSVRWAKLLPGVGGSATLQLRLGDRRRLDAADVDVSRVNGGTRVHIAGVLLPQRRPAIVEPAATPEASDADSAEPTEAALAQAAPAAADVAEAEPASASSRGQADAPHTAPAPRAAGLAPQPATGSSSFMVMLLITVLLGSVYGVVKLLARRRTTVTRPEIEVVSSKRLGPRHQLVVVRALGEDHLLSINRGETERLASMPTPDDEFAAAPEPEDTSDLLGRLREGLGLRIAVPEEAAAPQAARLPLDDGGRFGSQLMRAAATARYGQTSARAGSAHAGSEAVAGLMRLRERAQR